MRRLLILLVLLATFGLAAPALAAQGWEDVRDHLVAMPAGFTELNEPGTLNGKIDMNQLFEMSGQEKPEGLSEDDLKALNDAGYARTLLNAEAGDVLVIMGFRAESSDEAGYMVEGMLDSAKQNGDLQEDKAASTDDVHVYSLKSPQANGQAAVIRKGNYAYMFLVAGEYADPHKDLAKNLASTQLAALPAGSTEVGGDSNAGAIIGVIVLALIIGGVVAFIVIRGSKRAKQAQADRLAESGGGVDEAGAEQGVGAGYAQVGGGSSDPLAGGPPADPPLSE